MGSIEVTQASAFYLTNEKIGPWDTLGYKTMRVKALLHGSSGKDTPIELIIQRYPDKEHGIELDGVLATFKSDGVDYNQNNDDDWHPQS